MKIASALGGPATPCAVPVAWDGWAAFEASHAPLGRVVAPPVVDPATLAMMAQIGTTIGEVTVFHELATHREQVRQDVNRKRLGALLPRKPR